MLVLHHSFMCSGFWPAVIVHSLMYISVKNCLASIFILCLFCKQQSLQPPFVEVLHIVFCLCWLVLACSPSTFWSSHAMPRRLFFCNSLLSVSSCQKWLLIYLQWLIRKRSRWSADRCHTDRTVPFWVRWKWPLSGRDWLVPAAMLYPK